RGHRRDAPGRRPRGRRAVRGALPALGPGAGPRRPVAAGPTRLAAAGGHRRLGELPSFRAVTISPLRPPDCLSALSDRAPRTRTFLMIRRNEDETACSMDRSFAGYSFSQRLLS